jgi:dipeptidyl aminopeptidase/acylaminoacyl peptidase
MRVDTGHLAPRITQPFMNTWNRIPRAALWLIALASAASLPLAAAVDLSRETPVPANQQVPIVDFFRPPILWEPQLNLAGTQIGAILNTAEDHTELIVYDMQTQKFDRIGGHGQDDIATFVWLDSSRLMYSVRRKAAGGLQGWIAADVGSLNLAYPVIQFVGSYLIAVPPGDRLHPVVHLSANSLNSGKYGEVAVIGTDRFRGQIVELAGDLPNDVRDVIYENNVRHIVRRYPALKTDTDCDYSYLTDRDGKLAFGFKNQDGHLSLHQLVGDTWQQCPEDLEEFEVFGTGDNPGEIVVLGDRKDGKPRPLEVMEASSGKVLDTLWQDPVYEFDGWLYRDPKSNRILGVMGNRSAPFSKWFDEGYANLQKNLDKMFPGQVVRIIGTDETGKVVLFSSFSDRQPVIYHWANIEKHTAGMFKNTHPWIDPQRMQPMGVIKYKNRDGRQFDAYVTMPKGATKQNPPPLVVLPPYEWGGRQTWGYNGEAQFLASRGYAVLQPNIREALGFRWAYPKESEWAFRQMHDDVTDATRTMVASGLVDRNRVAIGGVGFGGYLALCGVAFEPSLYRCAVAVSPDCVDWGKLIEDQRYFKYDGGLFFLRASLWLGDPKKDPEKFDAISPLRHAGDIRVPVLVSDGEYDLSVKISMDKDLVSTVRGKGIAAESLKFLNEGSGVRFLDHRVELFEHVEAFLAKNLGTWTP